MDTIRSWGSSHAPMDLHRLLALPFGPSTPSDSLQYYNPWSRSYLQFKGGAVTCINLKSRRFYVDMLGISNLRYPLVPPLATTRARMYDCSRTEMARRTLGLRALSVVATAAVVRGFFSPGCVQNFATRAAGKQHVPRGCADSTWRTGPAPAASRSARVCSLRMVRASGSTIARSLDCPHEEGVRS